MGERIKEIIEYLGVTQAEFSTILGIQRANVSHFISGRNKPGIDIVQKILEKFPEISADWLLLGKGEMIREGYKKKQPLNLFTENTPNKNNSSLQNNNKENNIHNKENNAYTNNNNNVTNYNYEKTNNVTNNNIESNTKATNNSILNNNTSKDTTFGNNNSGINIIPPQHNNSINVFTSSPDHIVVLFDDQTFLTYRKRN